jgi:vacuolar-type H+-ATPase subunit H
MLSAAQEQAENTVATAKAEADNTRNSAAAEAQQVISDATRQAETAVATAKSQAKQQLDEATARATAIHDGAERRLNLLMSRHNETLRRLTEIRDVVTTLVAGETDRGSLEDEVARIVAGAVNADGQSGRPAGNGRPGSAIEGRHTGAAGQSDSQPPLSTAKRPGLAGSVAAGRPAPAHSAGTGSGQHAVRSQPGPAAAAQPASSAGVLRTAPGGPARAAEPVPPATPAQDSDDTATGVPIVTD